MTLFYYYLALINAAVSLAVAGAVFVRNRYRAVGPLFGTAMVLLALWMLGFAHYFLPLGRAEAMHWAKITLSASILIHPFLFHSLCALVEKMRRFRWWITAFYAMAPVFLVLLWQGDLLTGLRPSPYMTHYVSYNRAWYPILGGYILL